MKGRWFLTVLSVFCLVTLLTLPTSCKQASGGDTRIGVAVTILPLVEFVEAVGGERVNAFSMVPPGADPHTYEPLPSLIKKLADARMYVKVGANLGFETTWLDKLLSANREMLVVDSSKGVDLIASTDPDEPGVDPHAWISPASAKIIVQNIWQGLVQIDPQNEKYYTGNRDGYINKLDALDRDIRSRLKDVKNRQFIVFHPAWGYLARDYNLVQVPIEVEGKEPSAQDMANLISRAKANHIKVIFVTPQINPKSAEVIAREIGGRIVFIDDLASNYMENLRSVIEEMAKAME